jgi:hypothetical protein
LAEVLPHAGNAKFKTIQQIRKTGLAPIASSTLEKNEGRSLAALSAGRF